MTEFKCKVCDDSGWVCEDHPEVPGLLQRLRP